ncbi:MAG: hypothetical protein RMK18_11420 [Armatimonadota bacterium]|nr:hypothetical protein [Armatimonadota bacterium]MDW8026458.1 hypothetical protein [Armatimonadota bacterium]
MKSECRFCRDASSDRQLREGLSLSALGYGLFASLVLTLLAHLPVLLHMRTSFLGLTTLGDQAVFAWNLWWVHKALSDPAASLWFCDYIYHPGGVSLANHTLMPLHSFWLSMLMPKLGVTLCVNLLTLLSTWLTCLAVYLLSIEVGATPFAAIASMVVFGLSSFRAVELSGGHINVAMLEGVAFQALFILRLLKFGGYANAIAFAVSLLYICWTEKMGLLFAVMLDLALIIIHREYLKSAFQRALLPIALAMAIAKVGILPVIWLTVSNPMPFPKEPSLIRDATWFLRWLTGKVTFEQARAAVRGSWGSAGAESADLFNFVGIQTRNPFVAHAEGDPTQPQMPPRVFPGYVAMCTLFASLIFVGGFFKRSKGWLVAFLCFAIFCLGPLLRIGGKLLPLPLPYALIHYIPLLNQMRAPFRFGSLTSLCMALLIGMALSELHKSLKGAPPSRLIGARLNSIVCIVLCLLMLGESLSWWWRLHPMSVGMPPVIKQLASEVDDFALLEIPLGRWGGIASVGSTAPESLIYQCVHGKRLIGGVVSRATIEKVMELLNEPLFATLIALQEGRADLSNVNFDRKVALETAQRLRIRCVIVHRGWLNSPAHMALLRWLPLKLRYRDRHIAVYDVDYR